MHTAHSLPSCVRSCGRKKYEKLHGRGENGRAEEGDEDAARRPLFTLRDGLNVVRPCLGYPDDNLSLLNLCGDNLSGGLTLFNPILYLQRGASGQRVGWVDLDLACSTTLLGQ